MRNARLHRVAPFVVALPLALSAFPSAMRTQVVVPPRTPVVTTPKQLPPPTVTTAKPAAPAPAPVKAAVSAPASASLSQSFVLGAGERTSFGLVVGKPGPITVNVRWTGVPLIVSLMKPGGGSVDQQGSGSVALQYAATADDVKKGMFWSVNVRPAQPTAAPGSSSAVIDKPIRLVVANAAAGTVGVQYPPGDANVAQAELKAKANQALAAKPASAQSSTALASALAARQTALQTAVKTQQATTMVALKSKMPVQAFQNVSSRVAVQTKSIAGIVPTKAATKTIGTSQQADVSSAGSSAPATVVAAPAIGSLSVASGQPGDPVFITGSAFSNDPGEVHFIVANGKDIAGPLTAWSDTQLLAAVPDVSGIQGYSGFIYVNRAGVKSTLVPFRFNPATELRILGMPADRDVTGGGTLWNNMVGHDGAGDYFGSRGDDQFYLTTRLKNGWTVSSAYLTGFDGAAVFRWGSADAYVSEFRQGTDSPYVKVHWWKDAFSDVEYYLQVVITGPKGVPNF